MSSPLNFGLSNLKWIFGAGFTSNLEVSANVRTQRGYTHEAQDAVQDPSFCPPSPHSHPLDHNIAIACC